MLKRFINLMCGCVSAGVIIGCAMLHNKPLTAPLTAQQKTEVPSDVSISMNLNAKLNNADNFPECNLYADTFHGTVLLTGQLKNEQLRPYMLDVVRGYPGVKRIYDYTEVRLPTSYSVRSSDVVITTSIKAQLFGNRAVSSSDISVTTTDGVVYLMGLVTQQQAESAANKAALIGNVRKVITLFDYENQ